MGRKVRCYFEVDDPAAFLEAAGEYLITEGEYQVERDSRPETLIIEKGNTAWTVIGTHQWDKTSRTLIASSKTDAEGYDVEFLYDVSWLAIHFRPQREIRKEIDALLESIDRQEVRYVLDYDTQV